MYRWILVAKKATMWTPEIDRKGDSEREIEILINAITKTNIFMNIIVVIKKTLWVLNIEKKNIVIHIERAISRCKYLQQASLKLM